MRPDQQTTPLAVTVSHVPRGTGHLTIYRTISNGRVVSELFTLKSLADVLGKEPHTINALYQRRSLDRIMVPICNPGTRPLRGFHLRDLEAVEEILATPGARPPKVNRVNPEHVPEFYPQEFESGRYFTIPHLAEQIGRSLTATRARLEATNLIPYLEVIPEPSRTPGRPRRGWPEHFARKITDALVFGTPVEVERPQSLLGRVVSTTGTGAQPVRHDGLDDLASEVESLVANLPAPASAEPTAAPEPEVVYNTARLEYAWQVDPTLAPASDAERRVLKDWESFATAHGGKGDDAPRDPHAPDFLERMRAAFIARRVEPAEQQHEDHRREAMRLQRELKELLNLKSSDALESARQIEAQIEALRAPPAVPDVDAFIEDVRRAMPLIERNHAAVYGPRAEIFEVVPLQPPVLQPKT